MCVLHLVRDCMPLLGNQSERCHKINQTSLGLTKIQKFEIFFPVSHDNTSIKVTSEIHEIFYLNKQHPFAPHNWLTHISRCLLWSITSDKSDKATAPSPWSISCASLNTGSDGMSLSANLSFEIQASQLWHMLKQQQRCDYGMEERCQLLNDPLIYW